MKTKNVFTCILMLVSITIYGQDNPKTIKRDFDSLKSLNLKFLEHHQLDTIIVSEKKTLKQLKSLHPPTQENNLLIETYTESINHKKKRLLKLDSIYYMFTDRIMDKIFDNYQAVLSGSGLQNGTARKFTSSLDDKGIQFSYSRRLGNQFLYYNINASGKTEEASKDNFLSIFSKDSFFNNNITYSGGGDIFLFFRGTKSYYADKKDELHVEINNLFLEDFREKELKEEYKDLSKISSDVLKTIENYSLIDIEGKRKVTSKEIQTLKNNLKKLKIAGVVSTENPSQKHAIKDSIVSFVQNGADIYFKKKILSEADSLQIKAKTSVSQKWLSLGGKYNINALTILDSNFPVDTLKTKTYINDAVSLKLSYNYFTKFNDFYLMLSPTVNFTNQRNFDPDNLTTSSKFTNYNIAENNYQVTEDKPVQFYKETARRVNVFSLECPTSFYLKEKKFGIDLNFKVGVNDPNDNNVSAKLGIYIPINSTDNKIINIEPLFRFVKLFSSGQNNFLKDNVQFGFILAVTVPSYTKLD